MLAATRRTPLERGIVRVCQAAPEPAEFQINRSSFVPYGLLPDLQRRAASTFLGVVTAFARGPYLPFSLLVRYCGAALQSGHSLPSRNQKDLRGLEWRTNPFWPHVTPTDTIGPNPPFSKLVRSCVAYAKAVVRRYCEISQGKEVWKVQYHRLSQADLPSMLVSIASGPKGPC